MRGSGILLPISSLPSPYGIGTMGTDAYAFVDFLAAAGQRYWQILPIGPTGYGDSPYQCFSAFAGNPYWIDLDKLVQEGLLDCCEIEESGLLDVQGTIDYQNLFEHRFQILRKATARMDSSHGDFRRFCAENEQWIQDYALFMSIKKKYGMVSFDQWPEDLRMCRPESLLCAVEELSTEIRFWAAVQFLFYQQWMKLKTYANGKNVKIIGDIPIYVSPDSSDLWADPALFQVDQENRMAFIAGCPPDYFNETGQRWGNPLYEWSEHKRTGFAWWVRRLSHAANFFDVVRIDHFRGFAGYYSIPIENPTAIGGQWHKGPGEEFVCAVKKALPEFMIIAEDLGFLTDDVRQLLKTSGFPGMKVLQFAFGDGGDSDYLPHKHEKNSVVYTGTHDNFTTPEWENLGPQDEVSFAREYLGLEQGAPVTHAMIRAALGSVSDLCVIPIQDWLGLSCGSRINAPGQADGNWRFRMKSGMLTQELCEKIHRMTRLYGR